MSTKPKHTIEQSRKIISENFNIYKEVFTENSFEKILKENTNVTDSTDFLKNIGSLIQNNDSKFNDLMKQAGKLLKNNNKLESLIKKSKGKGKISYDNILMEGVKLLEEDEKIQTLIAEIDENVIVQKAMEKTPPPSNLTKVVDEIELLKFIEKTQVTHPNFKMEDMTKNIYEFFNQYPTKDYLRFPDGTIINMLPSEPAVDIDQNVLPIKDGIPQGEEAGRIVTKNMDTGVVIASPPGVLRAYFITRYGTPKTYDHTFEKYEEIKNIAGIDFSDKCYFNDFECNGKVRPIICLDIDTEMNCCRKHHNFTAYILNLNIALISDITQFYSEKVFNYLTHLKEFNKIKVLKKMKILIELAEKGRLKNRHLDPDFKLYGIHYYSQYSHSIKKHTCGWALIYYSIAGDKKKICHIYLDEITDDQSVINAICIITKEVLFSKYDNDLEIVHNYIMNNNQRNYDYIGKAIDKAYIIDMIDIIKNKLIF
jgi:hypothetical protein